MKEFLDSPLLGSFARALAADMGALPEAAMFPCRPVAASTAGNRTMLGRYQGAVSLRNSQEFKNSLADLAQNNPQKIILDLAEASLSKTAMGILVDFASDGHGRNNRLYLFRPSPQIRGVLRELELQPFFSILETEEDLLASLII